MRDWLPWLIDLLDDGPAAVVTVLATDGSTPRDVGARMLVTGLANEGTIGGGALEYQAIAAARAMLAAAEPWQRRVIDVPLGPAVQQCCGGYVRLLVEVVVQADRDAIAALSRGIVVRPTVSGAPWICIEHRSAANGLPLPVARAVRAMASGEAPAAALTIDVSDATWLVEPIREPLTPLHLYGAGHVAREVVAVLAGLPYEITWVDVARGRFPDAVDEAIDVVVTGDPASVARGAPGGAVHVVMTFSHALDEAITAELLRADTFAYLGLIGSKTKRARFVQRFRRAGIPDAAIARLTCPIGLPDVAGKTPRAIAISLAAQLVALSSTQAIQANPRLTEKTRTTKGAP